MKKINWLKLLIILVLIVPGAVFALGSAGFLAYIFWPQGFSDMSMPVPDPAARHIIVLSHGVRDTRKTWSDPLKDILEKENETTQVISLDWTPYANSTFRCSVDGRRIGFEIGKRLAAGSRLKSVHLIGHSCGSFVVHGICEGIKDRREDISVQNTFLDPVSVLGGIFWDYGIDHFGACGDFSEAYIDTGDTIPGSNQLLPHTHTFDVTEVREKTGFSGLPHVWPTVYYQSLSRSGKSPQLSKDQTLPSRFPVGVMEKVTE